MTAQLQKAGARLGAYDSLRALTAPKAQAIIALRAAMRVLPVLSYRRSGDSEPFAYWNSADRGRHALAIVRCYQASAFVNSLTKADSSAANAAAPHADAAASAANANASNAAAYAAYAASNAATAAADAAKAAAAAANVANVNAYAANATKAAANAAPYAAYAAPYAANAAAYAASLADIKRIEKRIKSGKGMPDKRLLALLSSTLWPEAAPTEFNTLAKRLSEDLQSLNAGFEVWIDWYQDRLDGRPFDWEIERQWALIRDERV